MRTPTAAGPRRAFLTSSLVAACLVAGCGGESTGGGGGTDPAAALPAGSPIYFEAVVRPEGDRKADVESVLRKLGAGKDPIEQLIAFADSQGDRKVTFRQDIEPWLGDRVGGAITGFDGDEPTVAIVVSTTDADATQDVIERLLPEARSHNGVKYRHDRKKEFAAGIVDDVLILGDERAFKQSVDATKGDSLAESEAFERARDASGDEGLGFMYANGRRFIDLLTRSGELPPEQADVLRQVLQGQGGSGVISATLEVEKDQIRIDGAAITERKGDKPAKAVKGDSAAALAALPSGALLGVGVGAIGANLDQVLSQVGGVATGGFNVDQLVAGLRGATGVDLRRDLLSWMGDGGVFVRGAGASGIGGALVVNSTDPKASQAVIPKLERALRQFEVPVRRRGRDGLILTVPGLPFDLRMVARESRFVIAVDEASLRDALEPSGRLGDDPAVKAASRTLEGTPPALFLDLEAVLALVGTFLADDPGYRQISPYLQAFGAVVAGTERDGDVQRARIAIGIR